MAAKRSTNFIHFNNGLVDGVDVDMMRVISNGGSSILDQIETGDAVPASDQFQVRVAGAGPKGSPGEWHFKVTLFDRRTSTAA